MAIEDLVTRIKDTPISQVINAYVPVVKKGNAAGLRLPFHNDTNPSMNINDHKGMWYCFVDSIGGDGIKFVQLYKNLEFMDALKDI